MALTLASALFLFSVLAPQAKNVNADFFTVNIPDNWDFRAETSTRTSFFSAKDKYMISFVMAGDMQSMRDDPKTIWLKDSAFLYEDDLGGRSWGMASDDRFCQIEVVRPYPGLQDFLGSIKVDMESFPELVGIIAESRSQKVMDWLTYKTPSPAGRPAPKAGDIPDDSFPPVPDAETPSWIGSYCNKNGCIEIANQREGPMGYSLYMSCTVRDKEAGSATAPVTPENGRQAGYGNMLMTLSADGKTMTVISEEPKVEQDPDMAWVNKCMGTYTLKE